MNPQELVAYLKTSTQFQLRLTEAEALPQASNDDPEMAIQISNFVTMFSKLLPLLLPALIPGLQPALVPVIIEIIANLLGVDFQTAKEMITA